MATITQERLKELLHYDPETGIFRFRSGKTSGFSTLRGYIDISLDRKRYRSHRLAWLYVHGSFPKEAIDHINGVRDDNRISNLREATKQQNQANTRLYRKTVCGAKGVGAVRWNQFQARIYVNGKSKHLGNFWTIDEAAHAYNKAAIQYFGEFACLNPIGTDK